MSSAGSGGPGGPGLEAAHLQPDLGEDYDWTDTAGERRRAAAIDRLAGDRDLVGALRRHGFEGHEYVSTARELARYGVAVLTAWTMRGTIFDKCVRVGRGVQRPPPGVVIDRDEAQSLAGEVVAVALRHFREEVLLPGLWDPSRGASLTTFFVGQCVLRFPNLYRQWLTQQPPVPAVDDTVLDQRSTGESVEDDVITERMTAQALQLVRSPDARRALVMTSMGYPQSDIAKKLATTEKAVERMIAYAREQVRKGRRSA